MSATESTKMTEAAVNGISPKTSPTKAPVDASTNALNLLTQGKRHMLVRDVNSAVNTLEESCKLLATQFGETSIECADAYYTYGLSLLEMARLESGVLGNALDGVPEGDDMENSQVEDPEKLSEEDEAEEGSEDGEEKVETEDAEENSEESEEGKEVDESQAEESQDEGEKTEEEEEVCNLQVAWEMLELAKFIYEKQESDEYLPKIAQIHLKLGEVGMENENYQQSVADIKLCLDIQAKLLKSDDRCLAETYYQLGVAHSYSDEFDSSIESFRSAAKVITDRISNLEGKIEKKKSWTDEQKKTDAVEKPDPFYTEEKEIEELEELLPEIKEKIVDMEEMKKDSKQKMVKAKQAAFASMLGGASSSPFGAGPSTGGVSKTNTISSSASPTVISATKATGDITHLIRKKRNCPNPLTNDAKKVKLENGDASPVTPLTNGSSDKTVESEKMEVDASS